MPETVPAGYIEKIAPDGQRHWFKVGTPEEKIQAEMQPVSTGEDVAKSIPSGLARGVAALAGMPGDIKAGGDWLFSKIAGPPPTPPPAAPGSLAAGLEKLPFVKNVPGTPEATGAIESVTGPLYEPQTSAGKITSKIAEFAPNIAAGPGGLVRKAVTQVVAPAIGNEVAGQATEGTKLEPYARIAGTLLGGITPSAAERSFRPGPVTPSRQRLIDTMTQENIPLTAGQRTGSRRLQNFETELGGEAYARARMEQGDAASRAALARIGEHNATRATTDVMQRNRQRIGAEFDRLQTATPIPLDTRLQNDLLNSVVRHQAVAGTPAAGAEFMMNRIAELAGKNGGVLEGEAFKNIRSEMGEWIARGDAPTKQVLRDMQDALDDAVERNLSPQLRDEWQTTRRQYKNYIVLEDVMSGGTPDIAEGIIPPARLRAPDVAQNQRRYVEGRSDFSELAHAGEGLLREPPQSGTAGRLRASAMPAAIASGVIGAGHAASTGDISSLIGSLGAGGAIMAAPAVAGRAVMSRPVQNWLAGAQPGQLSEAARRQLLLQALTAPRLFNPPE